MRTHFSCKNTLGFCASCGVMLIMLACGIAHGELVINEFSASNDAVLQDEDGDYSDWIELLNTSSTTVDLEGWYLRDEGHEWQFPSGVSLEPGGILILFASGKDRTSDPHYLHTDFALERDGDYLALVRPDGSTVEHEFFPTYPEQQEDISYGLAGERTTLIPPEASLVYLVPIDDTAGTQWRGGNEPFDETEWAAATAGVGYSTDADPDLQAYWAFDGANPTTATDSSGYGRDGTINGAGRTPEGKIGGALEFDGNNDSVSVNVPGEMQQMTLSMWVNFDYVSAPEAYEQAALMAHVGDATGAFRFTINSWGVPLFFLTGETDDCDLRSSGSITLDNWHHIAVTYDDLNHVGIIYIDGKQEGFTERTVGPALVGSSTIGVSNGDHWVDGRIDEVAVWSKVLDEEQVAQLAEGVSADDLYRFTEHVATDIAAEMQGSNPSVYMRVPFAVADLADVEYLTLRMKYDDGFVAWLNGTEVAFSNAPAEIYWDSSATSSRPNEESMTFEYFNLTPYLSELHTGTNILAIQGLNIAQNDEDFLVVPELNAYTLSTDTVRFFETPTPGRLNFGGFVNFVVDTSFSVDRGFYYTPFSVAIDCDTEGATIRYTLDYSEPTETHGSVYTVPVAVSTTTCLRAAAFKPDWHPTDVDTHTYVFPDDVAGQSNSQPGLPAVWGHGYPADYEVDPDVVSTTLPGYSFEGALESVPTMSIVTDAEHIWSEETGFYYNDSEENEGAIQDHIGRAWERPTSVELFYPDGSEGFHIDCGVRMHGDITRLHAYIPKHSLRLYFRGDYGPKKLDYPLFPDYDVDTFDQLVLRACSSDAWPKRTVNERAQYIRDQWMRDTQIDQGQPSSHGTYVQVYLNGLYWGMYNVCERLHDSFWAENFGGEEEEYDVIKDWVELHSGSYDAWREMMELAAAGLESDEAYQRIQGNDPDGTRNPAYPVYLDVDNLIGYMILHIYASAEDWPGHNWWAGRRQGPESEGFKFASWDQENVLKGLWVGDRQYVDDAGPAYLYDRLRQNAAFRQRFADRVHEYMFNGGVMTPEANYARWMERATEIDQAIVGESARWGDMDGDNPRVTPYKREVDWLTEQEWLTNTFWSGIEPVAVQRFRSVDLYPDVEGPVFYINGVYQHGGYVLEGDSLSMVNPDVAGTIYYTLDGSDPQLPPTPATVISSTTLVNENDVKTVLVPTDSDPGDDAWRTDPGFDDSGWTDGTPTGSGTGGVGYENGSGYEDYISIDVHDDMFGVNAGCYIRIPFTVGAGDLDDVNFMTLNMRYDDGFVAYVNGVRVAEANAPATPAWNSTATSDEHEAGGSFDEFDISDHIGTLAVGDNLLAVHGMNASAGGSSDFLISAELVVSEVLGGGGGGVSPAAEEYLTPIPLTETTQVNARVLDGASWSALTRATFYIGDPGDTLRITEIMYHPADGGAEFIELQNTGGDLIDITGVHFSDGIEFTFPGGTILEPGEYVVLVSSEDQAAFESQYPGVAIGGLYVLRLSNGGEHVRVSNANDDVLTSFTYDDVTPWPTEADGSGYSLVPVDLDGDLNDPFNWRASMEAGGSPGEEDTDGDSDDDGLPDEVEESLGLSPNDADTDDDGLSDWYEVTNNGQNDWEDYTDLVWNPDTNPTGTNTDALNPDTDGDGVEDGTEVAFGSDPLDSADTAAVPAAYPAGLLVLLIAMACAGLVPMLRRQTA